MRIATWNLGNRTTRTGKFALRPEAAEAAIQLGADIIVFTELFPNQHEPRFCQTLADFGWRCQHMSAPPLTERANRVFVASKIPVERMTLTLPSVDEQFPANLLGFRVPSMGLSVLAVRIPWYNDKNKRKKTAHLIRPAWEWLEATMTSLKSGPSMVIGDLNVKTMSPKGRGGDHFRRILSSGWHRAPGGPTFFNKEKRSEIDHILATDHCVLSGAMSITEAAGFVLAGPGGISDHAALVCRVERRDENQPQD